LASCAVGAAVARRHQLGHFAQSGVNHTQYPHSLQTAVTWPVA
jgi:hypothetical protein